MSDQGELIDSLEELGVELEKGLPDGLLSRKIARGELAVEVEAKAIVDVMRFLRDDPHAQFPSFIDLCAVDYPEREKRFELVYHLLSPKRNLRLRVRLNVAEGEAVPSVTAVYPGANWYERECWDMYGVTFTGHPDLRRLLTDYGFEGHPQRKDFPLTGYTQARYDDELKKVVHEPVDLRQEFRDFDFLSPWEGMPREESGEAVPNGSAEKDES